MEIVWGFDDCRFTVEHRTELRNKSKFLECFLSGRSYEESSKYLDACESAFSDCALIDEEDSCCGRKEEESDQIEDEAS